MGEMLDALSDFAIQWELWGVGSTLQRIRKEQWLAASRIVAGLDSVREAVQELRASVDKQTRVLEGGFATLDARLDFQTHVLGRVLGTLYRPSEVKARELRERGERALHARLYDDALTDFDASLAENRYDFTCHFAVGAIQWEQLGNEEAARNACELALRYAQVRRDDSDDPSSAFYSSLALLLMGRISEASGALDVALDQYAAACLASPDYGDCFRHYASAAAKLGRTDLALPALRAAILIDEREAVLAEQDEGLIGTKAEIGGVVASLRDEMVRVAGRLAPLAERAVDAYGHLDAALREPNVSKAWSEPEEAQTEEILCLLERNPRLLRAISRANELRRRGGLLDVAAACRDYWAVISEVRWVTDALESVSEASARLLRRSSKEMLDSTREWADIEPQRAKEESRSIDAWDWLIGLWGAVALLIGGGMLFVAILSLTSNNSGDSADPRPFLLVGGALVLSFLIPAIWHQSEKEFRRRAREREARELLKAAEDTHSRAVSVAKKVDRALAEATDLKGATREAAGLLDRPDVRCSLILVDPGSKREGYDEGALAQALADISSDYDHSKSLSLVQAKEMIRDCPRVFLTDLSISDAEAIAAYLRREFHASLGTKRRFIGEFPPQLKAVEAPLHQAAGRSIGRSGSAITQSPGAV